MALALGTALVLPGSISAQDRGSAGKRDTRKSAAGPEYAYTHGAGHRMKLREDRIALRLREGASTAPLLKLGFMRDDLMRVDSIGWTFADTKNVRKWVESEGDSRHGFIGDLVEHLSKSSDITFVSPVFENAEGYWLTPGSKVIFRLAERRRSAADLKRVLVSIPDAGRYHHIGPEENGFVTVELTVRDGFAALETANATHALPAVKFAAPNFISEARKAAVEPTEPWYQSYENHWQHRNFGSVTVTYSTSPAPTDFVQIEQKYTMNSWYAWQHTTGDPNLIVMVMDDGVQQDHPDINQLDGRTFLPGDPNVPGGDGGPENAWDNHGTMTSSMISAKWNGVGVAGIAPDVKILSAKVVASTPDDKALADTEGIMNALAWAAKYKIRITSQSLFCAVTDPLKEAYKISVEQDGMIHFAATHNFDENEIVYPARDVNVLAVGAADPEGYRVKKSKWTWGSNYSKDLDFLAPGVFLPAADRTGADGYRPGTYFGVAAGTSVSTPLAAGLAALILSRSPELKNADVAAIMKETCLPRPAGEPEIEYGSGLLNCAPAIENAVPDVTFEGPVKVTNSVAIGAGISVWINAELANNFIAPAGKVHLKLFLREQLSPVPHISESAEVVSTSEFQVKGKKHGPFSANTAFPALPDSVEPGFYHVYIGAEQVDSPDYADEEKLDNNVVLAEEMIEVLGPDLAFQGVKMVYQGGATPQSSGWVKKSTTSVSPKTVSPGDPVNVEGTVINIGDWIAPKTDVTILMRKVTNQFPPPYPMVVTKYGIGTLHPNKSQDFDENFTVPQGTAPGQWEVIYHVDFSKQIGELKESNNRVVAAVITVEMSHTFAGVPTVPIDPKNPPTYTPPPVPGDSDGDDGIRTFPTTPVRPGGEVVIVRQPTIIPTVPIRPEPPRVMGLPPRVWPVTPAPDPPRRTNRERGLRNAVNALTGTLFQGRDADRAEEKKEKSRERDEEFQRIGTLRRLR